MGVSIHDLLETLQGLQGYAKDLRHAASQSPFSYEENRAIVPMDAADLKELAGFLEGVAEEIQTLIPNQTVKIETPEQNFARP